MALPGSGHSAGRGHGGHAARAVNLDTGHHVDALGNVHRTHPGNPAMVGPDTLVFAGGHPVMSAMHHKQRNTAIHKRMMQRGNPHPHDVMAKMLPGLLPGAGGPPMPQMPQGAPQMMPSGMMGRAA